MRPTEAEMAILGVLWERGPSTVRQVHGVLEPERGTGYTTVLKLLRIMFDKGLVSRDERLRSHVYEEVCSRPSRKRSKPSSSGVGSSASGSDPRSPPSARFGSPRISLPPR
jgi:predicted transcriptional regulator